MRALRSALLVRRGIGLGVAAVSRARLSTEVTAQQHAGPQAPHPPPSYYKRELPANCVALSGREGRRLFREALDDGTMEGYFNIAEHFRTQQEPAYCGLGSLVMALNALGADPKRVWKGPWRWLDEEMLECCSPLEVIKQHGTTMQEFSCLASCNGAKIKTKFAERYSEQDLRNDIKSVMGSDEGRTVLVVSYSREHLGQTGTGHFSPIGGYHAARDLVLIMDVARFKYPPHWVSLSSLHSAMMAHDPVTGKSRGWHLLSLRQERLSMLHFPAHLTDPEWLDMAGEFQKALTPKALLQALVAASEERAFPQLVEGMETDRWHMVSRIRNLEVFGQVPSSIAGNKRLAIALLHESLTDGGESEKHAGDKPFQLELKAISHVFQSVEHFCKCSTCT